jgi:hypothetical protein
MNMNPSSANNAQKTPFAVSMNEFASGKIAGALQLTGKRLPCQVTAVNQGIVTVQILVNSTPFTLPQITVAVEQSIYVRLPIQEGDLGYLQAADTYIGNVTGLGTGTPDFTQPANLSALVYVPLSNSNWPSLSDSNSLVLQGPNGVSIWDMGQNSTIVLTPSGIACVGEDSISLTVGSNSITVNSSGITIDGNVNVTGTVIASGEGTFNGIKVSAHVHTGVTSGGSNTGPAIG